MRVQISDTAMTSEATIHYAHALARAATKPSRQ